MVAGAPHYQSGVAVASKTPFILLPNGLDVEQGRAMAIRVEGTTLVDTYMPIVCSTQQHLIERREKFDGAVLSWLATLAEPILMVGDYNLVADAKCDIVLHRKPAVGTTYFSSDVETNIFRAMTSKGYVDVFRALHPDARAYTTFPAGSWKGMRARIDYFMASAAMLPNIIACKVHPHTPVSDHAGVEVSVKRQGTNPWFPFDAVSLAPSPSTNYYDQWFKQQPPSTVQLTVGMVFFESADRPVPPSGQSTLPTPTSTAITAGGGGRGGRRVGVCMHSEHDA
jgi:exonuclease III